MFSLSGAVVQHKYLLNIFLLTSKIVVDFHFLVSMVIEDMVRKRMVPF